ncbi:uncharacterized protein LOC126378467 [Pectinophora gossypiella]|uniref:uncharacterized protein LOC126378467 n=1 Tax=Pectinophora gossypiella TaxID=13191 RepID=UPI00214E344E|nr:uncharacterized protein LOC126378467 [Pectinophora gossypiella]
MEENEHPHASPSSEVGCNREENQRDLTSNEESKWLLLMEQQNRNFMALINAMKPTSSASKDIRLPEFDPDKENVDARAWISTADMCITDPDMQGALLMMTLSRALKGQASTWLSQVSFHGMTWSNFKDLFTTRYESAETAAGFLINLQSSRPKDSECLASYASRLMSSLMSKWKNLSVEQIAVSTVLSHISQFENRVQRLAFTQSITTRSELQQELKAVSFMKRQMPSTNDHNHDAKKPRLAIDVSNVKCFFCGKSGHKAAQCRSRKGSNTRDIVSKTPTGDPKTSSTSSHSCFSCGGTGHFAKNCPRRSSKESNSNTTAGPLQEKRVNVCTVNAPTGMLRHAGASHRDV